ncbi:MAG TPA: hypothetical protein DCM38_11575 [Gammaproteobacteria bacterium]|nr:hypothetical protein [Gammaproteobacteria bacterium]
MLISFSLGHFKGFKKLEQIDLKALTVICGANNSGKSSIIQSLLLMKQSSAINHTSPFERDNQEPLILDGENALAHLGDWTDVIYKHKTDQKMSFKWKLSGEMSDLIQGNDENRALDVEIEVDIECVASDIQDNQNRLRVSRFQFRDDKTSFSYELTRAKDDKYLLKLINIALPDLLSIWIYKKQADELFKFKWTHTLFAQTVIDEIQFSDIEVTFYGLFPYLVSGDFVKPSYEVLQRVKAQLKPKGKPEYLTFLDKTLAELNKGKGPKYVKRTVELTNTVYQQATQSLRALWMTFRYLGPLREAPQRFYLINEIGKMNIGVKGEYTAIVLAAEQEQAIAPYYRCLYDGKKIKEYEYRTSDKMMVALNMWLSFMKLPQLMPTEAIKRSTNQIKLDSAGLEVCLPDVGFGVSQILPVLVECLRTQAGETIILEQPEIHLHPSLQSKLADFLICMAKAGKKIIVETHSEHLIKRLYLRVAQEESDEIRTLLNTLFVSFDEEQQTSITQSIMINEYGEIENWPVHFFDEDDSRELVAATLKKRMEKGIKK